jgi:hypothetical protein
MPWQVLKALPCPTFLPSVGQTFRFAIQVLGVVWDSGFLTGYGLQF